MITLILDNLRSTYNVGAILRTADATNVARVIATGTTPYPALPNDLRPPHVIASNTRSIAKVSLGAETSLVIDYEAETLGAIHSLRKQGAVIVALEQSENSSDLFAYTPNPSEHIVIILGPEVTGISPPVLAACDKIVEIPMFGHKESLNVSVAAGIVLYHLRLGRRAHDALNHE
jgi:23S rRNA (guanosine2251-2'-O)-methyltransferase